MEAVKRCTRCDRVLPRSAFSPNRGGCKECMASQERETRSQNRELYSARERARYRRPEVRAAKLAASKDYVQRKPHIHREASRRYERSLPLLQRKLRHLVSRFAKRDGKPISEDTREMLPVLLRDPCAYCGEPTVEIDHIDASGDSEWENLIGCCVACNRSKHQVPLLRFMLGRDLRAERDRLNAQLALLQPEWRDRMAA